MLHFHIILGYAFIFKCFNYYFYNFFLLKGRNNRGTYDNEKMPEWLEEGIFIFSC